MGFPVSAQPSYLYQSPSWHIFRLRIPDDIKDRSASENLFLPQFSIFAASPNDKLPSDVITVSAKSTNGAVMFNHSTQRQTLDYLCIQADEIKDAYMKLCL